MLPPWIGRHLNDAQYLSLALALYLIVLCLAFYAVTRLPAEAWLEKFGGKSSWLERQIKYYLAYSFIDMKVCSALALLSATAFVVTSAVRF